MDQSVMSNYIPEDCFPEILKRLPVKSLVRFRCMCRRWNALISSSSFVADHLAFSKAKPFLFIDAVHQKPSEEKTCVIFDSDSHATTSIPRNISDRIPALKEGPYEYDLIGSARGIICLHFYKVYRRSNRRTEGSEILLWNPVINKYMMLPETRTRCNSKRRRVYIAIGVKCSEEDDLRVLVFHPEGKSTSGNVAAEIYSVRHGAWRSLQPNIPKCHIPDPFEMIYNGNEDVHWVAMDDACSYKLIRFDFEDEEFSFITLPDVLADPNLSDLQVVVYHGRLALLQKHYRDDSRWRIWTRGAADSWSVLTEICVEADFVHGITHDGRILMSGTCDNDFYDMMLYDSTGKACRLLDIQTSNAEVSACPFVESLVFMDGEGGAVALDGVGDQELEETDDGDHRDCPLCGKE